MEGPIKKLAQYLTKISQFQSVEYLKLKILSIQQSSQKIFGVIDKQSKGLITSQNIYSYCQDNEGQLEQQPSSPVIMIGCYFGNGNRGIDCDQFLQKMRPIYMKQQREINMEIEQEEAVNLFVKMIQIISKQIISLESLKQELSTHCQFFTEYFYRKYGYIRSLTKQNLKEFMVDHNIYHRNKYTLINNYIFGEISTEISWQKFLEKRDYPGNQNIIKDIIKCEDEGKVDTTNEQKISTQQQLIQQKINDIQNKQEPISEIRAYQNNENNISENYLITQKNITQQSELHQKQQKQLPYDKPFKKTHKRYPLSTQFGDIESILQRRKQLKQKQIVNRIKTKYDNILTQYSNQNSVLRRTKNTAKTFSLKKQLYPSFPLKIKLLQKRPTQKPANTYLTNHITTDYTPAHTLNDNKINTDLPKQFCYDIYTNRRLKRILSPGKVKPSHQNNSFLNNVMFCLSRY